MMPDKPMQQQKMPVSRQVVVCLARIANDLDTVKKNFSDLDEKQTLTNAVSQLHEIAMAHDQAGGYGHYLPDEEDFFDDAPRKIDGIEPVVYDHALILARIQRAADWLKKHGVKIKSLTWHFFGGARIRVENSYKLYMLFSEGRYSQGHTRTGNTRIEHWQARDPVTNVLIEWDEETSC